MSIVDDAAALRRYLVEFAQFPGDGQAGRYTLAPADVITALGWNFGRLNDAITELEDAGHLDVDDSLGSHPFVMGSLTLSHKGRKAAEQGEPPSGAPVRKRVRKKKAAAGSATRSTGRRRVFVIHGRNVEARDALGDYLRALGLQPVFFDDIRRDLGASAMIGAVVDQGLADAHAVIALFTPDEDAQLLARFHHAGDRPADLKRSQARPNVLFEAGMAYASRRDATFLVRLGSANLFSDAHGIVTFHLTNHLDGRRKLRDTLAGKTVGCAVDAHATAWETAGDFESCVGMPAEEGPAMGANPAWSVRDGAYALESRFDPARPLALGRGWREHRIGEAVFEAPGWFRLLQAPDDLGGSPRALPARHDDGMVWVEGEHARNRTRVRCGVEKSGSLRILIEFPADGAIDLQWLLVGLRFAVYFSARMLAYEEGVVPAVVPGATDFALRAVKGRSLAASEYDVAGRTSHGIAAADTLRTDAMDWDAGEGGPRLVAEAARELAILFRGEQGGVTIDAAKVAKQVESAAKRDAALSGGPGVNPSRHS